MTNSASKPATGKVIDATAQAVTVTPLDGWRLRGENGFMAVDSTPAGRLVALKDLVLWLMDAKALPCRLAVEAVCTKLQTNGAEQWLYLAREGDYAKPVNQSVNFAYQPIRSFWEDAPVEGADDRGIAGAIKYMRSYWAESAAPGDGNWMGQHVLDPLCIRMDKAHELWGWGLVVGAITKMEPDQLSTYADLVAFRKGSVGAKWTDAMRSILAAEEARRNGLPGKEGIRKALGTELGISDKRVGELIREHQERRDATWRARVASKGRP